MKDVQLRASNVRYFVTSLRATIKTQTQSNKTFKLLCMAEFSEFLFFVPYLLSSYLFCLASVYLALYYYTIAHSVASFVGSPN